MSEPAHETPRVVAVDDDRGTLDLIRFALDEAGLRVTTAETARDALRLCRELAPDLLLLDLRLPDGSGYEVLRQVRHRSAMPVVIVTALVSDAARVSGLDAGADDYVAKPFDPIELLERVRAILDRGRSRRLETVAAPGLSIDRVSVDGTRVPLTRAEWALLSYLAARPGRPLPACEILAAVWGPEYADDARYLAVAVDRLRAKLGGTSELIRVEQGIGYRFRPLGGHQTDEIPI